MDCRDYQCIKNNIEGIIIKNVKNFNLHHVFECGQCFRWHETKTGSYVGVAFGRVVEVRKVCQDVIIKNSSIEEFHSIWEEYFDLKTNYGDIKRILSNDPVLKESIEFGQGIRILKQDPFELTISFIISANNRIPMIKKAIQKICETWGKPLEYDGEIYYTFPTAQELKDATVEDMEKCGTGFRAKYIIDTIGKINRNEMDLKEIKLLDDDECHKKMQEFMGVGPKVSDCIILFSMQKYSAFPVDVWVKRAMQHFYLAPDISLPKIRLFAREKFGDLSGFAQQYLFYWARENRII
ncbi:N-glycosylase/DNA lyase [Hathewaya proteolytica DSM 3090]|uniref:DNA-(apurinic or apyrimidinic site) lyase n=1 Tax=Hathewaya proteolytica DSM 3090 TaxID=1121331 RepID=A0A1M6KEJ0_9CLOT|nr:DNA glycosylase [Hathewaya proteolytica]SHJ57370.1 N-glycosylase/DNA lyase [Hathewaya proteolytica DSM 3090]